MKVILKWKRETKGAHFYQEVNSDGEELNAANGAVIQSLYVRKNAMSDPENPKQQIEFDLDI